MNLVEKEDRLGGWATKFSKTFPKRPPYKDLEDSGWAKLAEEVEADSNITVYKSTTVKKTSGAPGRFAVQLENGACRHQYSALATSAVAGSPLRLETSLSCGGA